MERNNILIKKRLMFFFSNIIIAFCMILKILSDSLMPEIMEYGRYQCDNISVRLINHVVSTEVTDKMKNEIVIIDDLKEDSIAFDTVVLNSIANNMSKKLQYYFYMLEKGKLDIELLEMIGVNSDAKKRNKGIVYEVPIGRALDVFLIGNLGVKIPIRYKLSGSINTQVISSLKEYGINNALLEVSLVVNSKASIMVPFLSDEEVVTVTVPLVMKLLQGDIPDSFFGTNVIKGGV